MTKQCIGAASPNIMSLCISGFLIYMLHFTDLKGKKRRDGSPDKESTPSVLCEGFQQDTEGQKRPIVSEEILALQIKDDDLMKVKLCLCYKNLM